MSRFHNLLRPLTKQRSFVGNGNGNSSMCGRVGLVLAAVLAIASTANAFPVFEARREKISWRVSCEGQLNGSSGTAPSTGKDSTDTPAFLSSNLYQRLNTPARLELNSHAVRGLFSPRKIAKYEIYKRLDTQQQQQSEDTQTHIVTALVDFGDSLDGHPGVVHGGILALVLDDIFGFAFGAIGVPKAVTANLSLDYRAPTPASTSVLIKVYLERQDNRKLYFKGEITSLDGTILYTESSCLYIIPKSVWEEMEN